MSNCKKNPRNHVISLRITDAEKYVLQQVAQHKKMTTSKALREALSLLTANVGNENPSVSRSFNQSIL